MPKSTDRKSGQPKTIDDAALDKVSGGMDSLPGTSNPTYPQDPKTPKGPKVPTDPDLPLKNPDTPPTPSPF